MSNGRSGLTQFLQSTSAYYFREHILHSNSLWYLFENIVICYM